MSKKKKWLGACAFGLYILTWLYGPADHARELTNRAQRLWSEAAATNERMRAPSVPGEDIDVIEIFKDGPRASVDWCIPILPCVMLANSGYSIGPVYGRGGVKIILFYGVGSLELVTLFGWLS
jgi:hypothetical protein